MNRLITKLFLMGFVFFLVGCGSDDNFVITSSPGQGTVGNTVLTVSLDTNSPSVPDSVTEIQVEIFDVNGNSVQRLTASVGESTAFDLPPGNYLVRLTGRDGAGNVVGFFDRVVTLTAPLQIVIPGLRGGAPPAVTFPDLGQSFFLFTALPTSVVGGEKFDVSVQAYSATGEVLNETVGGVNLTGDPLALEQSPTAVTDTNGQLTFSDVCFVADADGTANLVVTAPGFAPTNSFDILVAPVLIRASMNDSGEVGDGGQGRSGPTTPDEEGTEPFGAMLPDVSGDGRYTAFQSHSTNLVPGDTNNAIDVFVFDRVTRTIERVSVASDGTQGNNDSTSPDISADGRLVVFNSVASNLVPNKTNSNDDIFVHDRQTGETTRVSVDLNGNEVNSFKEDPSISADGRFVAFAAQGDLLNLGGNASNEQVYVVELATGNIELVSRFNADGNPGSSGSFETSLSSDGNRVAFLTSSDLTGEGSGLGAYFYDATTDTVTLASKNANGDKAQPRFDVDMSADGNFVVYYSSEPDIVVPNTSGNDELVYLYDIANDTTELISRDDNGNVIVNRDAESRSLSSDGRYVVSNIEVPGSVSRSDVYVYDRQTNTRRLLSVNAQGVTGNGASILPNISDDGRFVAFTSDAQNLLSGSNPFFEIFISLNLFLR